VKLPEPYKACSCRNEDGKLLGKKCPDRDKKGHSSWYGRYEAPALTEGGPRRRPRIGPFATQRECQDALTAIAEAKRTRTYVDTGSTRVGAYLDRQLALWESETLAGAPDALKRSTLASYRESIALYIRPAFGHLHLSELSDAGRCDGLRTALRQLNRPEGGDPSEMLRRLLEARAVRDGARVSTRPLSEARITRIFAVMSSALAPLVPDVLPRNPARRAGRRKGARTARPLLWTEARTERWRGTGEVPGAVMVWTPEHCGAFLDSIGRERLYALFHIAAYYGPRRSELAGLCWPDVDLSTRRVHVRQAQVDEVLDSTKSEDSERIIVIGKGAAEVLGAWRKMQLEERMLWGSAWTDSGRVFTREDGTPLRPAWISQRFNTLASRAELPPITLHGLRHGAATMLLAAGQPPKVVSEILGHSTVSFTMDVYTSVAEELQEQAAAEMELLVPRRGTPVTARTINGPSGGRNDR
jgi:integrase